MKAAPEVRIHRPLQTIGISGQVNQFLAPIITERDPNMRVVELGEHRSSIDLANLIEREGVQVAVSRTDARWTADVIRKAPTLAAVLAACRNPHVDIDAARQWIDVLNSPINGKYVAERTVRAIGAIGDGSLRANQDVREGQWTKGQRSKEIFYMEEAEIGVLGFGNIGQQVVEKLIEQGAKKVVVYNDGSESRERSHDESIDREFERLKRLAAGKGVELLWANNIDDLLENSRILTLHMNSQNWEGQSNDGVISAEHLRKLGGKDRAGILVNIARRELLGPSDAEIEDLLRNNDLAFYYTDVFPKEDENPATFKTPFTHPNAFGSAHLGGSGELISRRTAEYVQDTLLPQYLKGRFEVGQSSLYPRNSLDRANRTPGDLSLRLITSTQSGVLEAINHSVREAGINESGILDLQSISDRRAGTRIQHPYVPRTLVLDANGTAYDTAVREVVEALIEGLGPELRTIRPIPTSSEQHRILLKMDSYRSNRTEV